MFSAWKSFKYKPIDKEYITWSELGLLSPLLPLKALGRIKKRTSANAIQIIAIIIMLIPPSGLVCGPGAEKKHNIWINGHLYIQVQ